MGGDDPAVRQFYVRKEALVAAQDAPVGEGRQLQDPGPQSNAKPFNGR